MSASEPRDPAPPTDPERPPCRRDHIKPTLEWAVLAARVVAVACDLWEP